MEQKLYVKLFDQRARQTLERTAVEAEMASAQPALTSALAWLSQCETALATAQADLESALAARQALADGEDPTNADALVASSSELVALRQGTTESARGDYLALKGPQDARQARVDALTSAIDQCSDLMAESGLNLTEQQIAAIRTGDVRDAVWGKIKAHRDAVSVGGCLVGSDWFHNDAMSRGQWERMSNRVDHAVMLDSSPYTLNGQQVQWKTMSGAFVALTAGKIRQVVAAMELREAQCFTVGEQHRAGLNAAADPLTYDWSGGWPATF